MLDWRNLNEIRRLTSNSSDADRINGSGTAQAVRCRDIGDKKPGGLHHSAHRHATGSLDRFPIILGCDVVYEPQIHEPILNVLDRFLTATGVCWLADPGRSQAADFATRARERGYRVSIRNKAGTEIDGFSINQFQMLVLQHATFDA